MKIFLLIELDILCESTRVHSAYFNIKDAETKKVGLEELCEAKEAMYIDYMHSDDEEDSPDSDFDYVYLIQEIEVH